MENVIRNAFTMKVKSGFETEYKIRHDQIWPELTTLLSESGICDYSIFLDEETNILFGVQKVEGNIGSQDLGFNEIQKKYFCFNCCLVPLISSTAF